ncbi:MAG TPA: hypothetical protein VFG50_13015 [Rhodothermales bacterium]|nr:hypothetical protein [Rhodothermales bacterium]
MIAQARRYSVLSIVLAGVGVMILAGLLVGCCCTRQPPPSDSFAGVRAPPSPAPPDIPDAPDSPTFTEMRNVHFRYGLNVAMEIRHLSGEMTRTEPEVPIFFDDPGSFVIHISNGEIGLSGTSLTGLLNGYVFDYEGAPLRSIVVSVDGSQLNITGILHKVVDIPFEMGADVSATAEGDIRLHPTSMRICTIPGMGLMDALGVQLEDLMDVSKAPGVRVQGNDLLLDPETATPPPAIRGRVTAVRVDGDVMLLTFRTPADSEAVTNPSLFGDLPEGNWMLFRGGTLHFGKLYMVRADLQLLDADPSDAFDFFLSRYAAQLVAGYSRVTPAQGLKVSMPDYGALRDSTGLLAPPARAR